MGQHKSVQSLRRELIRAVVTSPGSSRYNIAKGLPYPNSTVYYELSRLEQEGHIRVENGLVYPTLKGLVEYVDFIGCDAAVVRAAVKVLGADVREGVCEFLESLRPYKERLDDNPLTALLLFLGFPVNLDMVKKLSSGISSIVAKLVADRLPAVTFAGHRGILFIDEDGSTWFVGYCERCGGYVADRCPLLEPYYHRSDK
ncbi:MAG: hypothetical protein ACP5I3_05500 [Thermoproteus sp.]